MESKNKLNATAVVDPKPSLVYYVVRWILGRVVHVFFREIEVVGKENVPSEGPIIFVGNHPNQFVDGMMMFSQAPRDLFMVIAESSLRNYALAGLFARLQKAIPVYRREDYARKGEGTIEEITEYNDLEMKVVGKDTKFTEGLKVGDAIILHLGGHSMTLNVIEVIDDDTVIVKGTSVIELSGSSEPYTILPKIDQTMSYSAIYSVLNDGNCIGIFPEGGSSDQVSLRNLKVGVAYLSLSALQKFPDTKLTIVPCGLNYIAGHRFRSKTLIEFGPPLTISSKLVERFTKGDKKAVDILTGQIHERLRSVTLNFPDFVSNVLEINPFEAKDVITTARRMYQPSNVCLSIQKYLELNRRFAEGFGKLRDEKKAHELMRAILLYNRKRKELGLTDRQAESAPPSFARALLGLGTLFKRLIVLAPCILTIPGILLHLPIGALAKWQALRIAEKAAKKSDAKIEGRDVIASTKIAFGFVIMLIFYVIYGLIAGKIWGWKWAPIVGIGVPIYTYFCIKALDPAAHLFRHSWPLIKYLFSNGYRRKCATLRLERKSLQDQVREAVNEYGPRFHFWDHRLLPSDLVSEIHSSDSDEDVFSLGRSYISEHDKLQSQDSFSLLDDIFFDSNSSSSNSSR